MEPTAQPLPLRGVKVLELSHIVAGPSGGLMLADLGAEVIKIEDPETGDTARGMANQGTTFFAFNRNKQYLALDMRGKQGQEVFARLVREADVVLDNFAPGALDRMGLGYEWGRGINPRIVYCSIKGFLNGPYADRPFLDELAQMAGSLAYLTGLKDKPMRAGASITDIGAATYAVMGILAALYRRERTGLGEHVQAGLFETIVFWVSQHVASVQVTGRNPPSRGERESGIGGNMGWGVYRLFDTRDGRPVFIAVTGNRHWQGLCEALGFTDWKDSPEYNSNARRTARKPQIAERVAAAVANFSYAEITERLYRARVPYAPVNTPMDLLEDRHMNEGGHWLELEVPSKRIRVPKLPFTLARTEPGTVRHHPGNLGADTDAILAGLGYGEEDIAVLKQARVVSRSGRMLNVAANDG